ncbi:hypothetical protein ES703_24945 [subsurface metagenome]
MERHEVVCIGQTGDLIVWGGRQKVDTPSGKKLGVVALSDWRSAADLINSYYIPEYDLDLVIGFMDAFGIEFLNGVNVPVIGWIPIDGPFTPKWKNYVRDFQKVIAYSHFGFEELQEWFHPTKIGYIPHGISEDFRPMDKDEVREEFEEEYGVPKDAFLAVNVGANVGPRKELPLMMRTFKRFVEDGHDDAYLLIHTNAHGTYPRGYDLPMWRAMLGMEEHILFPDYNPIISPVSNSKLARVHNAGDTYWQNSVAEGFMLPGYEAMACGIPPICPRNSAQVEIVKGNGPRRGWLVESVPEDMYVQIPVYVPQLPTYPVPDQRSALEKLEEAYDSPDLREKYGKAGRAYIEKYHNWELVMGKWFRALDKAEAELDMFKNLETIFSTPLKP